MDGTDNGWGRPAEPAPRWRALLDRARGGRSGEPAEPQDRRGDDAWNAHGPGAEDPGRRGAANGSPGWSSYGAEPAPTPAERPWPGGRPARDRAADHGAGGFFGDEPGGGPDVADLAAARRLSESRYAALRDLAAEDDSPGFPAESGRNGFPAEAAEPAEPRGGSRYAALEQGWSPPGESRYALLDSGYPAPPVDPPQSPADAGRPWTEPARSGPVGADPRRPEPSWTEPRRQEPADPPTRPWAEPAAEPRGAAQARTWTEPAADPRAAEQFRPWTEPRRPPPAPDPRAVEQGRPWTEPAHPWAEPGGPPAEPTRAESLPPGPAASGRAVPPVGPATAGGAGRAAPPVGGRATAARAAVAPPPPPAPLPAPAPVHPAPVAATPAAGTASARPVLGRATPATGYQRPATRRQSRADDETERAISVLGREIDRPRVIAFANPKGGVHKTTATVLAAASIGSVRGRGVLAWDDNELRGTLGLRAGSARHARTIRHLIADLMMIEASQGPELLARLDDYLRHAADGSYDVLAGEENSRFAHRLDQHTVRRVLDLLRRTHNVICVDTGNNVESPNWQTVLRAADQLVVTTVPREDAAFTADWMLDHLHEVGMGQLAENAVTLLSCPTPGRSPLLDDLQRHFLTRTRAVAVVPYDPVLETGSSIEYAQLQQESRDAWLQAAAVMVEPFVR